MLLALLLALSAQDQQFLKDVAETRAWRLGRPSAPRLTEDGATVLFLRSPPRSPAMQLYAFDVASGQLRELITPEQILGKQQETLSDEERARRERMRITTRGFTSFEPTRDGKQVLVTLSGKAYIVPIAGGSAREVAGPGLFDPRLSPDGTKLGYVKGGELWVTDLASGQATQLTKGATPLVTHAQAEFVAQEELDRYTGWWWSPDSKSVVYEETDSRGVEPEFFGDPAHPEKTVEATPYPRPGKANAKIAFATIPATGGGQPVWIDYDHAKWEYVSRVSWQEHGPLALIVLSRDQKDLALLAVDPATGKTRQLLAEHDDAFLNAARALQWLPQGGFLWSTERNGAWQLVVHDDAGKAVRELTPPKPFFRDLMFSDGKRVVFAGGDETVDSQIFETSIDGAPIQQLTRGPDLHGGSFAKHAPVSLRTTTFARGGWRIEVIRADGSVAGELPSVAEKPPFDVKVSLQKAAGMWTALVKPHNFDPRKKYPVIVDVYGGPHSLMVHASPDAYILDQWYADHGYLVFRADGRGTPGRGREWERAIKDNFAFVPLDDQVKALQALAKVTPAMDLKRVGVEGHSFGGFMAALSVERRPDVYRAAVAGAPVVDWLNYDTAYTERYLGVPAPAGSSDAYARNGLLPYAKDLTRPLLIVHGTADDNVHFEESLHLVDALFRAGRSFEFLPMLGQTHLFVGPELNARYYERVFNFFDQNLRR